MMHKCTRCQEIEVSDEDVYCDDCLTKAFDDMFTMDNLYRHNGALRIEMIRGEYKGEDDNED